MTTYPDIVGLLDASVGDANIGAHGPFWRQLSRDQFVAYQVFNRIPLLATDAAGRYDPDESNLVKALEGRDPFGRDQGVPGARYPRMPKNLPPMPPGDIKTIRDWISAGCLP